MKVSNKIKNRMEHIIILLEAILTLFIVFGVFIGIIDLFKYLTVLFKSTYSDAYVIFQNFLGHVLLLVIGLELVIMLIKHTADSVLEVLTLAIARKLLIYATTFLELLLGLMALALVFVIRKFLHSRNLEFEADKGILVGAATRITEMNRALNTFVPTDIAETVGGLIARLAKDEGKELAIGTTLKIADLSFEVVKIEDGVIEKVKVRRLR